MRGAPLTSSLRPMAIYRIQCQFDIAGAPGIGKWQVYRGGYFSSADTNGPSSDVRNQLRNMFLGLNSSAAFSSCVASTLVYRQGASAMSIKAWRYEAGQWVGVGTWPMSMFEVQPSGGVLHRLPMQCAIAVGYRADLGSGVPRQRGRSRFFLGPLALGNFLTTGGNDASGLARLSSTGVDALVGNAVSTYNALAGLGWTLGVMVGGSSWEPVSEFYVDDVIDVQRGRRTWQTYQKRTTV